jgi:radical SAM superfamily enzyme YgiQ (UPF0313 family)
LRVVSALQRGVAVSRVALVGPELEENLSLRYIAASLARAGHASDIIAFNRDSDLPAALERIAGAVPAFDVVGVSLAFQWRAQDFLALVMALRERGFGGHVTLGGHFATFAHHELLRDFPEVDSICRNEADETMVRLTDAIASGASLDDIPGLSLRDADGRVRACGHAPLPDLARLPWPDRRGAPARCFGHGIAPLVSSRGCYANCTFCCIAAWHEQTSPGKRYRVRDVEDVADEMAALQRDRGVDIFVFHDDNFFVPGHKRNVERFSALADALDRRAMRRFATVVKARPTDVDPQVFDLLRHRLHCIRAYIGIETDADQGLRTLRRWAKSSQNHVALEIARERDLFTCFNMLIFDPDTTLESLETNIAFMEYAADHPFNFARVELYAGTPLLARMQVEGRTRGDYMQWDYDLASNEVERVFAIAMRAFTERNFGEHAPATEIMAARFDVEVIRHFHPDRLDPAWLDECRALARVLGGDTARGLGRIVAHVRAHAGGAGDADRVFADELAAELRRTEAVVLARARQLVRDVKARVRRGRSLTAIGDRVATPLQDARGGAR